MTNAGPDIGERVPTLEATGIQGELVHIPSAAGSRVLLVFVSPGCTTCAKLAPALLSLQREPRLEVILAGIAGDDKGGRRFLMANHLNFAYIPGKLPMLKYKVALAPYALLIDSDGIVVSKGMVNSLEDLESILNVLELSTSARKIWAGPLG